jgi:peptidoglycan hydrolase-like protein with peptidoglycan-binding domain
MIAGHAHAVASRTTAGRPRARMTASRVGNRGLARLLAGRGPDAPAAMALLNAPLVGNRAVARTLRRSAGVGCGGSCAQSTGAAGANAQDDPDADRLRSARFADDDRLQAAHLNAPPLRQGEQGDAVAKLQQALLDLDYDLPISAPDDVPDGIYGPETARAVRAFQIDAGVSPPGGWEAGHKTLGSLDLLFSEESQGTRPSALPSGWTAGRETGDPTARVATRVIPNDPNRPQDLGNYRCRAQKTLRIQVILDGESTRARARAEVDFARTALAAHGVTLDVIFDSFLVATGELQTKNDLCDLIRDQVAFSENDLGVRLHKTRLPVFFVPGKFMRSAAGGGDDAGVTADSLGNDCADLGVPLPVGKAVYVDSGNSCPVGVLLHELGHAVGNVHAKDSFMNPTCRADLTDKVFPNQLAKFCTAPPFGTPDPFNPFDL